MNKKVLLISWHFPPYKSSSAFNLFKRLKDTGYDYDVLQIKRTAKPENEEMFLYASSCFNRYEIEVPSEDSRNTQARDFFVQKVIDFFFKLQKTNHYHVMISHSHEFVSHMAALQIKKLNPKLKWVASFGDPISANPYNDSYKFPLIAEDSLIEEEVLKIADRIVVTNAYQRDLMLETQTQTLDKDKFFILPHCYDERMYPVFSKNIYNNPNEAKVFRFVHVGMLYKFKRTSEPFLLGAQRLIEKYPKLKDRFTVEFYGAKDRYIDRAASYGLEKIVVDKGTVNYLDSLKVMKEADCLLLRDADFSDQGLEHTPFYPGKLADYLGAKRPIIAVTMAKGCVPDMLSKIGGESLEEHDIDGIANVMYRAIQKQLSVDSAQTDYYSHTQAGQRARKALTFNNRKKILVAGHDLKFAKSILEAIENKSDYELLVDKWQNHSKHDEEQSINFLNQADIIFCEWGLGNLVWYSKHKKKGQKLIARIHAQELKTRHLDECNHNNIDNYIFVSPYFFEVMIAEFALERKKCKMIFNMVDTELLNKAKLPDSEFHIGMIGDVPKSKRLDKALDIFENLYREDKRYKLFIKGKRPEEYPWMHSKAKANEMAYYEEQYSRIKENDWEKNVIFEGHGPIDEWLQMIGWILSVSDNESFHLSVAEGMASGAIPIINNWEGCDSIYDDKFIFRDLNLGVEFIRNKKNYNHSIIDNVKKYSSKKFEKEKVIRKIIKIIEEQI